MNVEYVVVDLETTGVFTPNEKDGVGVFNHIIQFYAKRVDSQMKPIMKDGKPWEVERFYHKGDLTKNLIKKIHTRPNGEEFTIETLTNLTNEFLEKNKCDRDMIFDKDILDIFKGAIPVAYNAEFEHKWLDYTFNTDYKNIIKYNWLCPFQTLSNYFETKKIKELDLLNKLGITYDENKLHNARWDVNYLIDACNLLINSRYPLDSNLFTPEPASSKQLGIVGIQLYNSYDAHLHITYKKKYNKLPTYSNSELSKLIPYYWYDLISMEKRWPSKEVY